MKFPVDLLADVSQAELERLAHDYMNNLLYSNPDCPDHLALSNSTQVTIDISSVGFVPLYGSSDKQKILALFSPSDPFTAVALYLLDRWWAVDEILKTVDPTRVGAVEVETVGERIVLYILNRVVYRAKEMSPEELPFLCHGEKDNAKILWNDGEAVGFYSVKPSGSFWSSFSTRSYQLPVMDSIFVRKGQRGKGFGLQMLEDFVLSFKEDCLGLRYPVTKFMYKVCEKYLCQYPGDTDLLWEVESIGGPKQRTNIARKIQAMDQSVSRSLTFTEESLVSSERTENDVMMEAIATQIKEAGSMECTVEIVEEVTVLHVTKVSEVEVPLTARGRSSGSKQRKMGEKIGEDKSEKVIRIEDIEAESPIKDQVSAQQKTEQHISELGISSVAPEEEGEDMVNTAPEDAAKMLDQPDTILAQEDLEEADVTSAPTTEEPQVEDDAPQHLNSISCDSQITVENVASEIEEECQEEDTAALAVSEEALEEAETLDKVGEGTQVGVIDEKTEETVTQRQACISTCATSENGEAGKTGIANVEAVTTVQTITPRRRYKRHSTVTMEEKQCEVSEICADIDANTPGGDDAEGNLPLAEVDESMSYEEEEAPVIETRALRRKTKTNTATPRRKSTRGRKLVDAQAENSEEEPAVTTRTLRRGRISTTDTPKGKSRGRRKQVQEETQKGKKEYKRVEETGVVAEAAVEKTDEEMEEIVDTVKETENEEGIELKIEDVEEDVAEQKPDAVEDVAEQKPDPVEDVAEQKPDAVEDVAEEKPDAVEDVAEKNKDAVEDVADQKPDAVEDVAEQNKDAVEDVAEQNKDAVEDVAEEKQDAEEVITGLRSDTPTEVDVQKAPEDEIEAENEYLVTAEVESEEGTMTMTVEEEDTAGVTAAADNLVQAVTDAPLPSPPTDSAVLPPVQEATPSAEEEQSEDMASQSSDLRRVTVVLVDLQKPHHDIQEEAAATEEGLPVEKTSAEAEEEATKIQDPGEGRDEETANEDEAKSVNVEEQKPMATETRTPRSGKQAVEATPRTRGRPRKSQVRKGPAPDIQTEEPAVQVSVLRNGRKSLPIAQRSTTKRTRKQLQEEEEEVGEESTVVEVREEEEEQQMTDQEKEEGLEEMDATEQVKNTEAEMALEKEDIVAVQGQDAMEDQSEGISQTSAERQVEVSGEEYNEINSSSGAEKVELPPVAATRSLRSGGKMSKALPKTRSKQSKMQSDEEEELEPPVVTTILNRERMSVRRSHKQLQKTEKGPEESVEEAEVQEEEEAGLGLAENPPTEVDVQKAPEEDEKEVENEDLITAEVESEEGTMTMTVEEEDTAGVTAAADDLVQAVTDAPLPSPPTDSAVLPPVEEATFSAEEQQSEDMASQRSDLRRVTVVLVDLQKPHHDIQEEAAAATEEGLPEEKTSAEAEEEQREETMKESETVAQENVPGSPVGIDKTELEERCEDEVEAVTKQDTEEARDEETEEAVEATPRTRCRLRKVRKEAASEIKTEDPAVQVRVSRTGSTTKRTCKQLQEDEEEEEVGEESTAIEAKEEEEQITDQEKEESREVEYIEAEITLEKDDIVAEDAVNQHDAQEEGRVDKTETVADEDTEASIEQHDHAEKTFVVAEEADVKQCTVEGEQSTSTSEVAESAQETMFSEKDEQANYASEEEAPVVERVLRSGEKTMRATTRSKTTKKLDEQEEKAPGEKSTEGNEPAVKIRVLRKGRKPADAAPRRKSKRARTQCQTEEGGEKEPTPTEEIEGEEEEAGQESPEEKGIEVEEIEKEEEAHNVDGEESTVGDAELTKDASTAEAGVLEAEDSVEAVDGTGTDTSLPSSVEVEETNSAVEEETAVVEQPTAAAEVGSDAAIAEKEALVEEASLVAEEDAPAATTRAFRSKQKVSQATPSPRRQKGDSPRRSVRKRPKVDYRENNEGDRDETEGNTDEEKEVPVASDEEQGTKTSECPSNANEVGEAIGSSQEDEEYEQNTSEEEEEPIVIGKRVLRGRSVPSVIITPQSKSRRRSAKVLNEEESPQSAQKRKITEVTRKSKRLSRI